MIQEIIGKEEANELKQEFENLIDSGANYGEVEDLMLSYGLEMDYILELMY